MLRSRLPEETLPILMDFLTTCCITRLADLSDLDNSSSLKVYSAIRPKAKSLSVSMGKSLDETSAKCSALAESIETFLAEEIEPQLLNTSYLSLSKQNKRFLKISCLHGFRGDVSDHYRLNWNVGYEYETGEEIYLPHPCISLNTNVLLNNLLGLSSRGIATGNTRTEAIVKGIFEAIEWEAVTKNTKKTLLVDKSLIAKYYLTSDYYCNFYEYKNEYAVPVVAADLYHKNKLMNQCIYKGVAASETYENSVCGALEEAIQSRVGVVSGARDDLKIDYYSSENIVSHNHDKLDLQEYMNLGGKNTEDILKELNGCIKKANKKVVIYEYYVGLISVVKTFIINRENYIL